MKVEKLSLFQNLTEDEIKRSLICSKAYVRTYGKDEYVFRQEDTPEHLYFILSGEVELGQVNALGKQNYVDFVREGQGFGEVDLFLEHESYAYFAAARKETEVLAVSRHFFYSTCEKNCAHHSKIIFNMMRLFAQEAEKNTKKIHLLTCGTLRQRIAYYLTDLSAGREKMRLPMNREDLAAYLNTTRPSLSRELSWMQDRGILKITGRNHVQILDFNLLQDELEGM